MGDAGDRGVRRARRASRGWAADSLARRRQTDLAAHGRDLARLASRVMLSAQCTNQQISTKPKTHTHPRTLVIRSFGRVRGTRASSAVVGGKFGPSPGAATLATAAAPARPMRS